MSCWTKAAWVVVQSPLARAPVVLLLPAHVTQFVWPAVVQGASGPAAASLPPSLVLVSGEPESTPASGDPAPASPTASQVNVTVSDPIEGQEAPLVIDAVTVTMSVPGDVQLNVFDPPEPLTSEPALPAAAHVRVTSEV